MVEQAEALSERIFSLIGTAELLEVYLGDRLGLDQNLRSCRSIRASGGSIG